MAEYAFFLQKTDQWRKEMGPLWGNFSVCPLLCQFQLPHHCQVELSSLNGLKAWGEGQKLCHDIAFLLVLAEDEVTEARNYGLSTIFVNPSQARVPCIEGSGGETEHLCLKWT